MALELIPIKPGQHSVVLVPRTTTDLPFFYHTKQKGSLHQNIDYRDVDSDGHPIRWQVFPNTNSAIGAPAIDAHEVWMRIVKPTIDNRRNAKLPIDIIPLGRVRECLRFLDWGEGGFQDRRLLKALHQIGAASCIADIWLPTNQKDSSGQPVFKHINATFSRLTLYAIGSQHVTEEQLQSGKFTFDFDLEDTLYIQLHPVEAEIQKNQPQRYIDNQYLFSVSPVSRRWYELMAGKIFGVVNNKAQYCEIRYSWYVKHHHTLKRHHERFRVVEQMNRVVKDHLESGYLEKVTYRKFQELEKEMDFIVRYYPGQAAKDSISRIRGYILNRNQKTAQMLPNAPKPVEATEGRGEQGNEQPGAKYAALPMVLTDVFTEEQEGMTERLIVEFGVRALKAIELVRNHTESVKEQLAAYADRKIEPKNKAGWFIQAVEQNYALPEEYTERIRIEDDRRRLRTAQEKIDSCELCSATNGYIHFARIERGVKRNTVRRCTHDAKREREITTQIEKENN